MGQRGAEFGEIGPKLISGGKVIGFANNFISLFGAAEGLDNGFIDPIIARSFSASGGVTVDEGFNAFRLGQQIFFWIGIANPIFTTGGAPGSENWITRVQLKPWWLRPNLEYRAAGFPTWTGLDTTTFAGSAQSNNRYCWVPSPKRLDITEFQTPPPPASPPRHSDSLFEDDVWTFDLQDPNDVAYQGAFLPPQTVSRWAAFFYPAMGYSLGFTWEATFAFVPNPPTIAAPLPMIALSYATGTLGGSVYQESIG